MLQAKCFVSATAEIAISSGAAIYKQVKNFIVEIPIPCTDVEEAVIKAVKVLCPDCAYIAVAGAPAIISVDVPDICTAEQQEIILPEPTTREQIEKSLRKIFVRAVHRRNELFKKVDEQIGQVQELLNNLATSHGLADDMFLGLGKNWFRHDIADSEKVIDELVAFGLRDYEKYK